MSYDTSFGATNRRNLLKGAAGLAVGATAAGMIPGGIVAAAGKTGMMLDLREHGSFELVSFSWGASQSGTTHVGGGAGAGKASFQDVGITKYLDELSPFLLQMVATGDHIPRADLRVTTKNGLVVVYELQDVIVTSLSTGGTGAEDMLTENASLNFAKFKYTVGAKQFEWNIAANTGA